MIYDVIVIGAGAAGMMAAAEAARRGANTLLLEKNEKVGRKIGITGKGRCNVTNDCDNRTFMENIVSNPRFLYSALGKCSPQDVMRQLEEQGTKLKTERGSRVFPVSDRAFDIIDALLRMVKRSGAKVQTGENVQKLQASDAAFVVQTDKQMLQTRSVVLATGGLSYPATGSTGDGHRMAEAMGLEIVPGVPGLIPLLTQESWPKDAMGVALKNAAIRITLGAEGKTIYEDFGELLFTHFGVSGPIILSAASHLQAYLRKKKLSFAQANFCLHIDLKSALSSEQLDQRLLRDLERLHNRTFQNVLQELLPRKLIGTIVRLSGIRPEQKACDISREQRRKLGSLLKDLRLSITGTRPLEEAIVTMGGIATKQMDPGTMMVKCIPGLFAAGELLDIDALTGGFNLQLAFATGRSAGEGAALWAAQKKES